MKTRMKMRMKIFLTTSTLKSGVGRDMYDEDDDEDDEDDEDDCHEFDDMMRLAKILAAELCCA
jgi:hypothetical protein